MARFQKLLEHQGAFRRVKTWRLQIQGQSTHLVPNWRQAHDTTIRESKYLWDSGSRRLILLVSDCTSAHWSDGSILSWLATCNQKAPTAVIQLLPERLWNQTVLGSGTPVWLTALEPGTITAKLQKQRQKSVVEQLLSWAQVKPEKPMMVPVIPLEAEPLKQWAKVMAGCGSSQTIGLQFDLAKGNPHPNIEAQSSVESKESFSPIALVQRFRTSASLIAQELAGLMSVAPVSPQIVDLIRQTLLPRAETVHVAEVFMGGLIQAHSPKSVGERPTPSTQYEFVSGVRTILSDALPKSKTIEVLDALSRYIAERLGLNINSFAALLKIDFEGNQAAQDLVVPFAAITLPTLQRMGGEYRAIATHLANAPKVTPPLKKPDLDDLFPLLQTFSFRETKISFERSPLPSQLVEFETATIVFKLAQTERHRILEDVRAERKKVLDQARKLAQQIQDETEREELLERLTGQWVIMRDITEHQQSVERLTPALPLNLMEIPAGSFTMGSPDYDSEEPQHRVTFAQPFLMSQTPITQAQWRFVAGLPQVDRELDPDPSNFKGNDRPVEQISWYDAIEFCARLIQFTGRDYRLPSEAEWEYACRAGTQTPFHFGETLSPELANYRATEAFEDGPTGEWCQETTDVGSFPANAFGLYDMHGNVLEWCQDNWHDSYQGAPEDGSAWGEEPDSKHVLRGGSWIDSPGYCRSANRIRDFPDYWSYDVGLRVVCGLART